MKKEKAKEFAKKYLIGFILGVISACTVSVIAATYFPSNDVTYDNTESGLTSTNVQGAIDELYGVCTAEPPAGEQIIEDAGLEKDPYECRYFFTGANPNNYITFNDEEAGWRIVSVECDGTIKIMKDESIGDYRWDELSYNIWNRPAKLNTYLNEDYYNSLTSTAQSQIIEGTYYVGAATSGNNDMQDQINDEKRIISKTKIALPTLSEYIRANSNENCKTFSTYNDNRLTCNSTNWMFYKDIWWTLTPDNEYSYRIFYPVNGQGGINSMGSTDDMAVRPVVTLSSKIKITGGDGSQSNPYTLE